MNRAHAARPAELYQDGSLMRTTVTPPSRATWSLSPLRSQRGERGDRYFFEAVVIDRFSPAISADSAAASSTKWKPHVTDARFLPSIA